MVDVEALARGVILSAWSENAPEYAGCILFARDGETPAEVRERTDRLRARAALTPLIAIDQEGGRVARLRREVEPLPSMMALGATGDEALATRAGEAVAHDLRRAGVTVDFAPLLDLAIDSHSTVIGTRAFGSDPQLVARFGLAFARGLRNGGIVPVFKHFPGHGSTAADSHLELPHVVVSERELRGRDLAPFAALARDAQAMMSAHVIVEALDKERPASLSSAILQRLLRGELQFSGVTFSDCLQMRAVAEYGVSEALVAAIGAGTDCALISHDLDAAATGAVRLAEAARRGEIPLERLSEAMGRVRRLRLAGTAPIALDAPSPHPGIGREIARRAVTLIRGAASARIEDSIAVSFEGASYDGAGGDGGAHVPRLPGLETIAASLDPSAEESAALSERIRASGRRPIVLARRAHLYPGQVRAIDAIVACDAQTMVVSAREPFDIPAFVRARHVLAIYGDDEVSLAGAADVLFRGQPAGGVLPVRV